MLNGENMKLNKVKEYILNNLDNFQPQNNNNSLNDLVKIKFFDAFGSANWYITDAYPIEEDILLYGFADLGDPEMAEFGDVSLNELLNLKVNFNGCTINRIDIDEEATNKTLKECLDIDQFPYWENTIINSLYEDFKEISNKGRDR